MTTRLNIYRIGQKRVPAGQRLGADWWPCWVCLLRWHLASSRAILVTLRSWVVECLLSVPKPLRVEEPIPKVKSLQQLTGCTVVSTYTVAVSTTRSSGPSFVARWNVVLVDLQSLSSFWSFWHGTRFHLAWAVWPPSAVLLGTVGGDVAWPLLLPIIFIKNYTWLGLNSESGSFKSQCISSLCPLLATHGSNLA